MHQMPYVKAMRNAKFLLTLTFCLIGAGKGAPKPQARIANGYTAYVGQFPWDVKLLCVDTLHFYLCGGSLIRQDFVLTAAHCVMLSDYCDVKLGHINDTADTDKGMLDFPKMKDIYLHPQYADDNFENVMFDVALIALPIYVPLSEAVNVITLPGKDRNYVHRIVTVLGWGNRTKEQAKTHDQVLKYAFMKVVSDEVCQRDISKWPREGGDEYFLCATHISQMICAGDCGGALVYDDDGTDVLLGVSVLGDAECQDPNKPQGFVRVSRHLEWIDKTMKAKKDEYAGRKVELGHTTAKSASADRRSEKLLNYVLALLFYLQTCAFIDR